MKFLNSIYFHVYNAYYKDGNYTNDIPHLTAYGIVGCSLSLLLTVIVLLINYLINSADRISFNITIVISLLGLIVCFFLFLFKKRYKKVYVEIKGSKFDNFIFKLLAWLIVAIGFVSVVLYSYLLNQPQ